MSDCVPWPWAGLGSTSPGSYDAGVSGRGPQVRACQRCVRPDCGAAYAVSDVRSLCGRCGSLLDVVYDWGPGAIVPGRFAGVGSACRTRTGVVLPPGSATPSDLLEASGVWRFRDLLPFWDDERRLVTLGEGRTLLQRADALACAIGLQPGRLWLQYEGFNPSGSFKDNGMAAAFTHAVMVGARCVACASTGNTAASLALYAAHLRMPCYVFVGEGRIAAGKLSQALDYGARTIQVAGDFDACLRRLRQIVEDRPDLGVYLMNSLNPFRLEGQKTIMYRVLEGLGGAVPDWIVVPGGNLGNCSAFGKAFAELHALGVIGHVPRLAVINAAGARTLDAVWNDLGVRWNGGRYDAGALEALYARLDADCVVARTVASAIEIARPVNLPKALRALETTAGVVRSVTDEEILDHKALVGRHGYGCEPASAASVAGTHRLVREGVIAPDDTVVCILTGHTLKDAEATVRYHAGAEAARRAHANPPVRVPDDLEAIVAAMQV